VYYSAFSPVPHADQQLPVEAPPLVREHRLYQADWLLRYYDFAVDELVGDDLPQLDLELDPKHAWALRNRDRFPIDVNRADRVNLRVMRAQMPERYWATLPETTIIDELVAPPDDAKDR
jgi:predicted DNA-binding helix-hairpin-helix protein